MHPCASKSNRPNRKKILLAHCAWSPLPISGGGHRCANILAHRCTPRHYYWRTDPPCTPTLLVLERDIPSDFSISCTLYSHRLLADRTFRCALTIFIPIAYQLSFTNRKRKTVAKKTTGPLKCKQTSITTVPYPILSVDRLPTPLIFCYPLPLISISPPPPLTPEVIRTKNFFRIRRSYTMQNEQFLKSKLAQNTVRLESKKLIVHSIQWYLNYAGWNF